MKIKNTDKVTAKCNAVVTEIKNATTAAMIRNIK
jgi:hypothetical protein